MHAVTSEGLYSCTTSEVKGTGSRARLAKVEARTLRTSHFVVGTIFSLMKSLSRSPVVEALGRMSRSRKQVSDLSLTTCAAQQVRDGAAYQPDSIIDWVDPPSWRRMRTMQSEPPNGTAHETEANRRYWESIAPRRDGQPAQWFTGGGLDLRAEEIESAGNVGGKRVLHLFCSVGDEAISWALLGARVVGVDFSATALAKARAKATAVGVDVDYIDADVAALPESLTGFDLIYLSSGAVCWIADLHAMFADLAGRLAPAGAILICDHHPFWEVLAVAGPDTLRPKGDYFGRGVARGAADTDPQKRAGAAGARTDLPEFAARVWPVSDVVMALIAAGLQLDVFEEQADSDMYPGWARPLAGCPRSTWSGPPPGRATLRALTGPGSDAGSRPRCPMQRQPDAAAGVCFGTTPNSACYGLRARCHSPATRWRTWLCCCTSRTGPAAPPWRCC